MFYKILTFLLFTICCISYAGAAFFPPTLVSQPVKDGTYHMGEALILHCKATGDPEPKYQWYRNGHKFDYSLNTGRYTKWPKEGTLVLAKPGADDDGIYHCVAHNDRGRAISNNANVRRAEIQQFSNDRYPRDLTISEGSYVKLHCTVPLSYPPPIVEWEKEHGGSRALLKDSNKYVKDFDGNLFITRSSYDEDNGAKFTCTAFNPVLRLRQVAKGYKITVTKSQHTQEKVTDLFQSIRNVKGIIGQKTVLRCIFGGNPQVNYRWSKVGLQGQVSSRPNIRVEAGGPLLVIDPVTELDRGKFRCMGENDAAQNPVIHEFVVSVGSPAKLITRLKNVNLPEGGTVELGCSAVGNPAPLIYWTYNGEVIDQNKFKGTLEISNNIVRLINMQKSDTGVFQCNATNDYGYDLSNGFVNILQDKPQFIKAPPPNMVKSEEQAIQLPCETFSAPQAIVSWTKDGYPISGGRYKIEENGNLMISNLITADSGTFTCRASNKYGNVSGSTKLVVRQKTELMIKPINTWVYRDNEVKFVCTAKTDRLETPNLVINWYKDYSKIKFKPNDRLQKNHQDNSLIIMGAMDVDNGVYSCNATNGLDYAVAYASLVVQSPPYQPRHVRAICNSPTKQGIAQVTWSPGSDNYAPIIQFIVEYSHQFDRKMWWPLPGVTILGNKMSVDVKMQPNIDYVFRVTAQNRVGMSEPSVTSYETMLAEGSSKVRSCSLPPQVPDSNPKELYVYGIYKDGVNHLVMRWTPMPKILHNGNAFYYRLTVTCLDCDNIGNDLENVTTVDESFNEVTMSYFESKSIKSRMEDYKQFKVSLDTGNSVGPNEKNPTVKVGYSADGVPSVKVDDLVASISNATNNLELKWTVITEDKLKDVKGLFRGYRVEWCKESLSDEVCNKTRQFQDILFNDNNQPVRFHNIMKRSVEEDQDSNLKNVQTVDNENAKVFERLALLDLDDEVSEKVLKRKKREVLKSPDDWSYGKEFTWVVKMLPGAEKIKIWVRILNNLWAGPKGKVIKITTPETTPGPVSNLVTLMEGINHVKIRWSKPNNPYGTLIGYRLGWRKITGLDLGYMTTYPDVKNATKTEYEMSGLKSGSRYRIFLWALTAAGQGVESFIDINTQPANIAPSPPTFIVERVIDDNSLLLKYATSEKGVKGSVFKAQYRKYGRSVWQETEPVYIQKQIVVDKLSNDTVYEIRIVATNGAGMVTPSDSKYVRTGGSADPTLPVGSNAAWIICTIIILIFVIILIILMVCFRDRRMEKLIGATAPVPFYDPSKAREDDEYGKLISGMGSELSQGSPPPLINSHVYANDDQVADLDDNEEVEPENFSPSPQPDYQQQENDDENVHVKRPKKHRKKKRKQAQNDDLQEEPIDDFNDDTVVI